MWEGEVFEHLVIKELRPKNRLDLCKKHVVEWDLKCVIFASDCLIVF